MSSRKLLYYYYTSSNTSDAARIAGAVIAGIAVIFLCLALWYFLRRRRLQSQAQVIQLTPPQPMMTPQGTGYAQYPYTMPPQASYPQPSYSTNYSSPIPPPVSDPYTNYRQHNTTYTRDQLNAMSVDELRSLKENLGLSHLGAIPKPDFIEIVMGLQASMQYENKPQVGSTTTSYSASYTNMQSGGSSASAGGTATLNPSGVNPATGLMECGMCFEPMGGGAARQLAVPPCGHAYCYECLVKVARQPGGAKCPGCRKPFTEQSITRVYS